MIWRDVQSFEGRNARLASFVSSTRIFSATEAEDVLLCLASVSDFRCEAFCQFKDAFVILRRLLRFCKVSIAFAKINRQGLTGFVTLCWLCNVKGMRDVLAIVGGEHGRCHRCAHCLPSSQRTWS